MLATGGLRAPVTQQRSSCLLTMTCYPRLRSPPQQHAPEPGNFTDLQPPFVGVLIRNAGPDALLRREPTHAEPPRSAPALPPHPFSEAGPAAPPCGEAGRGRSVRR